MIQHITAMNVLASSAGTEAPALDYRTLAPLLIMFGGACVALLLDAFVRRTARAAVQLVSVFVILIATMGMLIANWHDGRFGVIGNGLISMDKPTYVAQGALIIFTALCMILFSTRHTEHRKNISESERTGYTEVYVLALFSLFGMMLFTAANNLLMLFVALEAMSLPLYILCGLSLYRRRLSQEASLKYFLLGVLAAAIMLYGIVMVYAATGDFTFASIAQQAEHTDRPAIFILGIVFVVIGLLFKVGAVPFHNWVPDVYQGAPTPVTAFMAICTKLAAFVALARVLTAAVPFSESQWEIVIIVLAIISMLFGSILTMTQTDVKRLIAYSSITHAGFIMTALVGADQGLLKVGNLEFSVVSAILIYLAAYGLATIGALAIVTLVRRDSGEEATSITAWEGMGRQHPWLGAAFALYFLSFAGFPITAGFIGKFTVFSVAWIAGYSWLVVVALLVSALAAYAYLRMVIIMFFKPANTTTVVAKPGAAVIIVVVITAVLTVLMGILPDPVLHLTNTLGGFML